MLSTCTFALVKKIKIDKLNTISLLLILLLLSISGCKDDDQETTPAEDFVSDFYANAASLDIKVAYEEGAAPYTTYGTFQSWDVCEDNINSLLQSKNISISVPKRLQDMIELGTREQINYTRQNILDFAADISTKDNKSPEKEMIILFLDGNYIKDGTPESRILGVNMDGTAVVAIFKPVIRSASTLATEQAVVEQTTVVHEIGHVLGLVNKGVRATSAHHDVANGAHCTNTDCVMYWKNGGAEIQQFIQPFLATGTVNLFGSQCIADIEAK